MSDSLYKDLKLFNSIVEELFKEEKKNPVSPVINVEELYKTIDISLSENPSIDEDFTRVLKQLVLTTPKTATNRFFNQLWGGRNSKAVLGDLLAVMLNTSMYTYKISGPQIGIEKEIISKVCKIVDYGKNAGGTFPTGGSMSNFMALIMARDKRDGLVPHSGMYKKMVAYTSKEAHYSNPKNVSFAGIGKDNLRYISTNHRGEMITDHLEEKIQEDIMNGYTPFFVNATAGTTVLGAFDPIESISKICKKYNLWLHVDGAFCGAVIFSLEYKRLLAGLQNSDSFSFNAHKMLGTPLTCSLLLVKNKKHLLDSFNNEADYLYQTNTDEYDLGRYSFQCGRRNDALKFWSLWKAIGTNGLSKIVNHLFETSNIARDYVRDNSNYILYNNYDSLSICFNYKDYDPKDLCTRLYEENELLVAYGSFKGDVFIRLVTVNPGNKKEDILNVFKVIENFVEINKLKLHKREIMKVS
tara:strand:- start:17179 stop:18585 length:1407 start_codon:yes stop_codon:yes gene_type:complete